MKAFSKTSETEAVGPLSRELIDSKLTQSSVDILAGFLLSEKLNAEVNDSDQAAGIGTSKTDDVDGLLPELALLPLRHFESARSLRSPTSNVSRFLYINGTNQTAGIRVITILA